MKQYEAVVSKIIPALAPDPESVESDPSWSQEQAEAALFQRLTLEEELGADRGRSRSGLCLEIHGQGPSFGQSSNLAQCVDALCSPEFCYALLSAFPPIGSACAAA